MSRKKKRKETVILKYHEKKMYIRKCCGEIYELKSEKIKFDECCLFLNVMRLI